ncbi:MAG: cytochrome P450 [Pseudomonadota bacterium]
MSAIEAAPAFTPFEPAAPKPRPTPPANLAFLRSVAVLPKLIRNPLEAFSEDAFQDPVAFTQVFNQPMVLLHDPAAIRAAFVDHAEHIKPDRVRQTVLKPALRDGLLTAEGALWKRSRRTLAPVFAPRHVNGFSSSMIANARTFAQELAAQPGEHGISEAMSTLAYRVLSATLFSGDIDRDTEQVLADVSHFLEHLSHPDPLDFLGAPSWMPRLTKLRGHAALARLRQTVRETARQRMGRIEAGDEVPSDFLTLLLQAGEEGDAPLTMDEVEDNIITFIAAGHETTARALAWTLYLLSQDSDARQRCEAEADALDTSQPGQDWAEQAPWIMACFEEAMRLFPPAPLIARESIQDFKLGDISIAKGMAIMTSPYVLHRHQLLWDNPALFNPHRFYGEARKAIDRFAYLPFGMGPRVCIGQRFAMQEAVIILVELLRTLRFDYAADKAPWPIMRITIQPDNGMPMRVSPR